MRTFLRAYWKDIVMVNFQVPEEVLIPYLPYGTELDDFDNKFYVSLVGFRFLHSSIFGIPVPFYGSFDEVNLRFYVKRNLQNEVRRGVVFISELVPNRVTAFLANTLYKEHYGYAKMESAISTDGDIKDIVYSWSKSQKSFWIAAKFENEESLMQPGSHEAFIYEHYYGYTKVNERETWEYRVNHIPWKTNKIIGCDISCDFEYLYGSSFSFLQSQQPHSVYNATGSEVRIDWEIDKLKAEMPLGVMC